MQIHSGADSRINWAFFLRLYVLQSALTLIVAAGLIATTATDNALSALMGGMTAILPHMLIALQTFINERKSQSLHQIVAGFYKAEIYKFIYTAMLFAMAFKFMDWVKPVSLILTFIVVQSLSWIAPLILKDYWFKK